MRTRNIITILILCISNALYAQDSLLIGKWQLFEMQKDSVIIFNRDNVEIAIKEAINRQKSLDSAAIKNFKEITHPLMKKMFIEFLDNGNLNAGVLDLKEGKYVFKEKLGAYRIDGKKLGINLKEALIVTYTVLKMTS